MIADMLDAAVSGKPVYISRVHEAFTSLPAAGREGLALSARLLDGRGERTWELPLPRLEELDRQEEDFVREYLYAEVYNILSSLGAASMAVYVDRSSAEAMALAESLDEAFCLGSPRRQRKAYGRCINVLDRMTAATRPGAAPFRFEILDIAGAPRPSPRPRPSGDGISAFKSSAQGLGGKAFCGIDVGGTDIKAVLVDDGRIVDYKEYDWFPAAFRRTRQLVEPILLIARLMQARLWLNRARIGEDARSGLLRKLSAALDKAASDEEMLGALGGLAAEGLDQGILFDGIGLCFPDVVVKNKIVGGEVYKTRGIRSDPSIDYETDFAELTDLDRKLSVWVRSGGAVRIINDGPMASFTAAVEMAASEEAGRLSSGVFAHTLGTELGTGWVTEDGGIPDIPLEVYNFIIDLGDRPERAYEPDDLRSLNNFNTGLPGTLQKYCSQSGVFRLAMKYFPAERPDLFRELQEEGYIAQRAVGGMKGWYVPTEPVDRRKAFLEHMMSLPEREGDETNLSIWREIGESLAVTSLETRRILEPATDLRFLFGRLVKNRACFDLMAEGARRLDPAGTYIAAGTGIANTPLMKQLEENPEHSVAQFAQAVGAVHFANLG